MEVSVICMNGNKHSFGEVIWGLDDCGNLYIKYDDGLVVKITDYAGVELFDGRDTYRIMGIKQLVEGDEECEE